LVVLWTVGEAAATLLGGGRNCAVNGGWRYPGSVAVAGIVLLAGAGCGVGGDSDPSAAEQRKSPRELTAADLAGTREFWSAQGSDGRLVLTRICKAQVAQAAQDQAAAQNDDVEAFDAGPDASRAVYALDNEELIAAIDRSLTAEPGRTIEQACVDVARPEDTTVDVDGPVREARELGPAAFIASPRTALRLSGTVKPAREGADIEIWRSTSNGWEYFDAILLAPDGSFEVALKAYRAKRNFYRLIAHGGKAARRQIVDIHFDRPPPP
jgi:hypothetical protein